MPTTPAPTDLATLIEQAHAAAQAAMAAREAAEEATYLRLHRLDALRHLAHGERRTFIPGTVARLALWGKIDGRHAITATVEANPLDGFTLTGPCTYSHLHDH